MLSVCSIPADVVSLFQSSFITLTNNDMNFNIRHQHGAGFTTGDMIPISEGGQSDDPGHDNYVARNTVRQTGGVPAGVFVSTGNTILEFNCLLAGIQPYNYSGVFVGVTVRKNVINDALSFWGVPDSRTAGLIAGYQTNINSTDCSLVPAS